LGGYCFGGKVAFEMAHQLQAQGEEVSLVALIDAFAPGYRTLLPWSLRRLAQIKHHWQNISTCKGREKWDYISEKAELVRRIIQKRAKTLAVKVILRLGLPLPHALEETLDLTPPRMRAYSAKVYPGKLTIFAPMDSHSRYHRFESHLGWKGLAGGGLDIREIPGRVMSIIVEPNVKELARQLELCIDQASAAKSSEQNAA
jgi:thioesterase domain-containing protein